MKVVIQTMSRHDNGNKSCRIGQNSKGRTHGKMTSWLEDGNLDFEAMWYDGKQHGVHKSYYNNVLANIFYWIDDKNVSKEEYLKNRLLEELSGIGVLGEDY